MQNGYGSITPVRLLVAETSEAAVARFDSVLRDAGIATRVQIVDLAMAGDALPFADLMLCNAGLPHLSRILPDLHRAAPDTPIVLVADRDLSPGRASLMRLGATDLVAADDAEQLVLVVSRELEHVRRVKALAAAEDALAEALQRCEILLQTTEAAVAYVHEGMHIDANGAYLRLFGFESVDDILGLPLMDLLDEASADSLKNEYRRLRQQGGPREMTFSALTRSGSSISGTLTLTEAQYDGESCLQVTVARDAPTVQPQTAPAVQEPIERQAFQPEHQPPSTNIGSAGFCSVEAFVGSALAFFANPSACMAVLVIQIDDFLRLQADHGIRSSEYVSERIQRTLQEELPGHGIAHLAPNQLAVATRHPDRSGLRALSRKILAQFTAEPIQTGHGSISPRLSIGAALLEFDANSTDVANQIEHALDLACSTCFRLTQAGGNRFEVVGGSLDAAHADNEAARILDAVNEAIEEESFRLLFQPLISLRGETREHYEVFLRMVSAEGDEVRPDTFLSTAVEHGVAGKIDRWVILKAIKALIAHRLRGHDTCLTISLTANSIADPNFAPWLAVALKAANLPGSSVIFQVTEQDVTVMLRQAQAFIQALHAMDCRTSLARFTGHEGSFQRLGHLPVEFVKLDGTLTDQLLGSEDERASVMETLRQLHEAGKQSVVPKVETATMLSRLWQAGAGFVQGYHLKAPSSEMDFEFDDAG